MVMDACCIMFDLKGKKIPDPNGAPGAPKITDYWDDAKKMLNDPSKYLNSLMTYDKDNISPVSLRSLVPLLCSCWLLLPFSLQTCAMIL